MRRVEEIRDPELLQKAASLLEKTVIRQTKEITRLRLEVARLRGAVVTDPQQELELIQEQLKALQSELYGPSSERTPKTSTEVESPSPRRGHGPRPQPNLPIEIVRHELLEEDRRCSVCGKTTVEMGSQVEEAEEITVVELEYKLLRHQRQKYRCTCNEQVLTAPGPDRLVPGGRYSIDFAIQVAVDKYLDHLPLERQVRRMARHGLEVDSQTLWDQIEALARHLWPTYERLCSEVLRSRVILVDESYWRLMEVDGTCQWWTWCVASDELATYRILPSRSKAAAERILDGFCGTAMTDGYGAYRALERAGPNLRLAHCWAHVRRKFLEASDMYPAHSETAVALINELFAIERRVPVAGAGASPDERTEALELRRRLRDEESRKLVRQLRDWALEHRGGILPRSKMGKAIEYMLTLWTGLTRFLDDSEVPLDNNGAERALRGVVVGRKNHYGSRSKRGTEVAALFYTLLESAKLSGADPARYLREATIRAVREPGATTLPSDLT